MARHSIAIIYPLSLFTKKQQALPSKEMDLVVKSRFNCAKFPFPIWV
jgi:hypothetical protein